MRHTLLFFLLTILNLNVLAQSKKDQIASLQMKCDSLSTLLDNERFNCQTQSEKNRNTVDSLRVLFEKEVVNMQQLMNKFKLANDSLNKGWTHEKFENFLLSEKLAELSVQLNTLSNDIDTAAKRDFLALNKYVISVCKDESAKNKILSHISDKYNRHLRVVDSLSNLDEGSMGGSEEMSLKIIYSNRNYLAYEVHYDSYYGGAHPEIWTEQFLFEIQSGSLQNLESLITNGKHSELLMIFNKKLKLEERELNSCLERNEYSNLKFYEGDLSYLQLQKNGIYIEYSLSYAERACNPIVYIDKKELSSFFPITLFE